MSILKGGLSLSRGFIVDPAQYMFLRISRRALDAQNFDASENYCHKRTNRINWNVREH